MKAVEPMPRIEEGDDLRLLGLSRIPRCASCPRLAALAACYEDRICAELPLPAVPRACVSPYCAPLAARFAPDRKRPVESAPTDSMERATRAAAHRFTRIA